VFEECRFVAMETAISFTIDCGQDNVGFGATVTSETLPCLSVRDGIIVQPRWPLAVPTQRTFWSDFADASAVNWELHAFSRETSFPSSARRYAAVINAATAPVGRKAMWLPLDGESAFCCAPLSDWDTFTSKAFFCIDDPVAAANVAMRPCTRSMFDTPPGPLLFVFAFRALQAHEQPISYLLGGTKSADQTMVLRKTDGSLLSVDGRSLTINVTATPGTDVLLAPKASLSATFDVVAGAGSQTLYMLRDSNPPQLLCLRVDLVSGFVFEGADSGIRPQNNGLRIMPCQIDSPEPNVTFKDGKWHTGTTTVILAFGAGLTENVAVQALFDIPAYCRSQMVSNVLREYSTTQLSDSVCGAWWTFGTPNPEMLVVPSTLGSNGLILIVVLVLVCLVGSLVIYCVFRRRRRLSAGTGVRQA
jgi:hypothetical protein